MKVPILLPKVFNHPFTYETSLKLKLGDYVEVPFGNSKTNNRTINRTTPISDDHNAEIKKVVQKMCLYIFLNKRNTKRTCSFCKKNVCICFLLHHFCKIRCASNG